MKPQRPRPGITAGRNSGRAASVAIQGYSQGDRKQEAAASDWTLSEATSPVIPEGTDQMTFGLSFGTNGTLITDDYSLTQVSVPPSSGAGEFIVNGSLATGTNIPTCFMTAGWGNSQVNSEVREYFKDGLIVRKPNVDPQNLDTNKDGPACGPGD